MSEISGYFSCPVFQKVASAAVWAVYILIPSHRSATVAVQRSKENLNDHGFCID